MNRKDRIKQLEEEITALENSDERLYTDGNGNLARYKVMKAELARLCDKYSRKRVRCINTGIIYESATKASEAIGCGRSAMANHLAGRFATLRGMRFEKLR